MNKTVKKQRIFITGGTGYIGGSFLHLMLERDYLKRFDIAVLVRKQSDIKKLQALGVTTISGSLDDLNIIRNEASQADIIFNTANCDHEASVSALIQGLNARANESDVKPILIHTSGAGVLTNDSNCKGLAPKDDPLSLIWDETDYQRHTEIPSHAPHRMVDLEVFKAAKSEKIKTYLVVPPTVFGEGLGPIAKNRISIQIPRLIYQTMMTRKALFVGTGENIWPNVHVADLAELYLFILEGALNDNAPEGLHGLYYPATEHFKWAHVSQQIAHVLHSKGILQSDVPSSGLHTGWFWGSNVQVKPTNSINLGWQPRHGGTQEMLSYIEDDLRLVLNMMQQHRYV